MEFPFHLSRPISLVFVIGLHKRNQPTERNDHPIFQEILLQFPLMDGTGNYAIFEENSSSNDDLIKINDIYSDVPDKKSSFQELLENCE